jgi:hypothetical protein
MPDAVDTVTWAVDNTGQQKKILGALVFRPVPGVI